MIAYVGLNLDIDTEASDQARAFEAELTSQQAPIDDVQDALEGVELQPADSSDEGVDVEEDNKEEYDDEYKTADSLEDDNTPEELEEPKTDSDESEEAKEDSNEPEEFANESEDTAETSNDETNDSNEEQDDSEEFENDKAAGEIGKLIYFKLMA